MLPPHLAPFFWDIDTETFDPHSYPDYTIGRLLEFGNENAVAWLRQAFSEAEITRVLRTERRLSPRSANYWALVFGIPADEVRALRERQTGSAPDGEGENAGDP
jgi:hypothetical protein